MTTNLESPCAGCGKTPQTCSCNTPGPWEVHVARSTRTGFDIQTEGGNRLIAWNVQSAADAYLMAAAPQLLEALESADRLLTQCLTVLYDKAIADRIPFGLLDEVKHFVIKNVGTDAIRSAKGETL